MSKNFSAIFILVFALTLRLINSKSVHVSQKIEKFFDIICLFFIYMVYLKVKNLAVYFFNSEIDGDI